MVEHPKLAEVDQLVDLSRFPVAYLAAALEEEPSFSLLQGKLLDLSLVSGGFRA